MSAAKKGIGTLGILAIIAVVLFFWGKNTYNGLVSKDEAVKSAWAQVENVYQR